MLLRCADLNLSSMQQWSRKFPALCNFCGTLILQDDRAGLDPSADSSITSEYPTEHVASEELLQFEPAVAPGRFSCCTEMQRAYINVVWYFLFICNTM